ncbi:MAG TPA: hypothetical protein VGD17_11885, partial [Chitinophagaceae bacterium]
LSSGKVLVSTYLSLYEGNTLICMSPKDRNEDLPKLFAKVVEQIEQWNKEEMQMKRIALALDNTYGKQLERIEEICDSSVARVEKKVRVLPD